MSNTFQIKLEYNKRTEFVPVTEDEPTIRAALRYARKTLEWSIPVKGIVCFVDGNHRQTVTRLKPGQKVFVTRWSYHPAKLCLKRTVQ